MTEIIIVGINCPHPEPDGRRAGRPAAVFTSLAGDWLPGVLLASGWRIARRINDRTAMAAAACAGIGTRALSVIRFAI
jgi:hypothetical protein